MGSIFANTKAVVLLIIIDKLISGLVSEQELGSECQEQEPDEFEIFNQKTKTRTAE